MRSPYSWMAATAMAALLPASSALRTLTASGYNQSECKTVVTDVNFNLTSFAASPWYVLQQAVTSDTPFSEFYCAEVQYEIRSQPSTIWKYTINVLNHAQDASGRLTDTQRCAYQTTTPSKLGVASCYVPKKYGRPYWVIAYNESMGYSLVLGGGQPATPANQTYNGQVLCQTTDASGNNDGLWILSRSPSYDTTLIDTVRNIAVTSGLDVSILYPVNQTGCNYNFAMPASPAPTSRPTVATVVTTMIPTATPTSHPSSSTGMVDGVNASSTCADTVGSFKDFLGQQKDCSWVHYYHVFLCWVYADKCPATCGKCG